MLAHLLEVAAHLASPIRCAALAAAIRLLAPHASAEGSAGPALELAKCYVPIMEIRTQRDPCDTHGEGYRPTLLMDHRGHAPGGT